MIPSFYNGGGENERVSGLFKVTLFDSRIRNNTIDFMGNVTSPLQIVKERWRKNT